jgi:transmembrane sensor
VKENEEIKRLFKLYLEERTNPGQEEILFRYLADNKNKDSELHSLMNEVWMNEPAQRDDSLQTDEELEQIWTRLGYNKQKKIQRYQVLKYAASVVLVLSAAFGWYNYQKHQLDTPKPVELLSKATEKGEKVKMILPDSSVVYLAGNSKLTWPARFIKGSVRNIRLEGEAFFEVKHDASRPFIIQSGKMETRVLGTSFNIYAYPADRTFTVSVMTGKVGIMVNNLGKRKTLSLLTPGMELVYHKDNEQFVLNTAKINDVNSWTTNRFVFRDESLSTMLVKLGRYYNVHFDFKNQKLATCRFNATFSNNNIMDVMKQLSIMSGGNIRSKLSEDKTTIALWGKACQ